MGHPKLVVGSSLNKCRFQLRQAQGQNNKLLAALMCGFADDPCGHAALVLDYGGFDGVD
jgi:hypothetical protein